MEEGQGSLCGGCATRPGLRERDRSEVCCDEEDDEVLKELAMSIRPSKGCVWFSLEESEPSEEVTE